MQVGASCGVSSAASNLNATDIHLQFSEQYPNNKTRVRNNRINTSIFQYLYRFFIKNDNYQATQTHPAINDESNLHKEKDQLDEFLNVDKKSSRASVTQRPSQTSYQDLLTNPPKHTNKNKDQNNPFARVL